MKCGRSYYGMLHEVCSMDPNEARGNAWKGIQAERQHRGVLCRDNREQNSQSRKQARERTCSSWAQLTFKICKFCGAESRVSSRGHLQEDMCTKLKALSMRPQNLWTSYVAHAGWNHSWEYLRLSCHDAHHNLNSKLGRVCWKASTSLPLSQFRPTEKTAKRIFQGSVGIDDQGDWFNLKELKKMSPESDIESNGQRITRELS